MDRLFAVMFLCQDAMLASRKYQSYGYGHVIYFCKLFIVLLLLNLRILVMPLTLMTVFTVNVIVVVPCTLNGQRRDPKLVVQDSILIMIIVKEEVVLLVRIDPGLDPDLDPLLENQMMILIVNLTLIHVHVLVLAHVLDLILDLDLRFLQNHQNCPI